MSAEKTEVSFPSTVEELYSFVVTAVNNILTNPDNVNRLAKGMMLAAASALEAQDDLRIRQAHRNQVVRTEYPGCVRAILKANSEESIAQGGEPMTADLFQRSEGGEWVPAQLDEANTKGLIALVLSQSNIIPGEIYYVARSFQIEQLQDALIDQQLQFAETGTTH